MHHRKFSSVPGLYPQGASNNPHPVPSNDNQKVSRCCQMSWGGGGGRGKELPLVENLWATQLVSCSFHKNSRSWQNGEEGSSDRV